MHLYGIAGTLEHLARVSIHENFHVLDVGAGLGGVARVLAHETGCEVTGIELAPGLAQAATELTTRVGLSDRIRYVTGDALRLPFDDASFDHVLCHYVTMNIPDKERLVREAARVLKPGGAFSAVEATRGPAAPPRYPLPWASDERASHLAAPAVLQDAVRRSGLVPLVVAQRLPRPSRVLTRLRLDVFLPDWEERERNMIEGRREGRISDQFVLAEKRHDPMPLSEHGQRPLRS